MNKSALINSSEVIMIGFTLCILLILFIPIPTFILDFLLLVNFSWALTVLLLTFCTDKPLSFSTFPALLLISTLFRLALNVSATRLILSQGYAGRVINSMGAYVIHGNYVMGVVVFFILIIVQYVVVTNGAQRVAEVAARFTLDSMPGKQMSIDADLTMGIISQQNAKTRRKLLEKEANFYGAMDGASKFVKGDAIAGILILLVDILGGFIIGMAQKGLSLGASLQAYTLLTVGDGLVTQIPALIISTATGIIVTRAATDAQLGSEVARQIAAYPQNLVFVCLSLIGFLTIKGMPLLPVLLLLLIFCFASWFAFKHKTKTLEKIDSEIDPQDSLYSLLKVHPIEINLHPRLFISLQEHSQKFLKSIDELRESLAYELGFVIPAVVLKIDNKLTYPLYYISIEGNSHGIHALYFDKLLVILSGDKHHTTKEVKILDSGIAVKDPSYGLPAVWIEDSMQNKEHLTVYTALKVLTSHLKEVIHTNLAKLLTRTQTQALLSQTIITPLRDELIPQLLTFGQVQSILQLLLQEKVSIRQLATILEVLLSFAKDNSDPTALTEIVRKHLANSICQKLLNLENCLLVLTLAPTLENTLNQRLESSNLALEPNLTEHFIMSLAQNVESMLKARMRPVLLCSSTLRRAIKQLTLRVIPHLTVLSMHEIPIHIQVESFAVVS